MASPRMQKFELTSKKTDDMQCFFRFAERVQALSSLTISLWNLVQSDQCVTTLHLKLIDLRSRYVPKLSQTDTIDERIILNDTHSAFLQTCHYKVITPVGNRNILFDFSYTAPAGYASQFGGKVYKDYNKSLVLLCTVVFDKVRNILIPNLLTFSDRSDIIQQLENTYKDTSFFKSKLLKGILGNCPAGQVSCGGHCVSPGECKN